METSEQDVPAVRLERLLVRAAEAEAKGDLAEAERTFRLALICEAKLRPDVPDAAAYVRSAGRLYPAVAPAASGGSDAAAMA